MSEHDISQRCSVTWSHSSPLCMYLGQPIREAELAPVEPCLITSFAVRQTRTAGRPAGVVIAQTAGHAALLLTPLRAASRPSRLRSSRAEAETMAAAGLSPLQPIPSHPATCSPAPPTCLTSDQRRELGARHWHPSE